jgi:hypothetical protein
MAASSTASGASNGQIPSSAWYSRYSSLRLGACSVPIRRRLLTSALLEVLCAGDLRIQAAVVGDVVAVAGGRARLAQRRQVAVADAWLVQVT